MAATQAFDPRRDPDRLIRQHELAGGDRLNVVLALADSPPNPLRRLLLGRQTLSPTSSGLPSSKPLKRAQVLSDW
jgi:hypothetical protein